MAWIAVAALVASVVANVLTIVALRMTRRAIRKRLLGDQ
jgi:hypothetical protein